MHLTRLSLKHSLFGFAMLFTNSLQADIELPQLFTDNMVLQREKPINVWGKASAGESITVVLANETTQTVADTQGNWSTQLPPMEAGGPHTFSVKGNNSITLNNILIGEVWICSGQSNMEMGVANVFNGTEEIKSAQFPGIRLYTVEKATALTPQDRLSTDPHWMECSSQSVGTGGWGGFSATAYFFGRHLHQQLNVPVGLIHTSWGGTICEAWTSAGTLKKLPDFAPAVEQVRNLAKSLEDGTFDFDQQMAEWWNRNDPGSMKGAAWAKPGFPAKGWKTMHLPVHWEKAGLPNFDGIVWFRKSFELPADWEASDLTLHLGPIDDIDTTFVNGVQVGGKDLWLAGRDYKVPSNVLRRGRNVIAVRILDTGGDGGIYGTPDQLKLEHPGNGESLSLAGDWIYQAGKSSNSLSPAPQKPNNNPNVPTVLYNAMIAPLVPYTMRGAIWYQGESNANRAYQYRSLFPSMIKDWRQQWGQGDFPFGFVQLANFMEPPSEPADSAWAELREAQNMTLSLPHTGQAVIIDIGEAKDIHPRNKQDVGKRLALWAEANVYEQTKVFSGPQYRSMKIEDNRIRLSFDSIGSGLKAKGSNDLKHFAIAGQDKQFVWAKAIIDGDTVIVSNDQVSNPVAVRYAWADNPEGCNLYNREDLPASPFRTDNWQGITVHNK